MDLRDFNTHAQALLEEFNALKEEMKTYANANAVDVAKVDSTYLRKANFFSGDISPARLVKLSDRLLRLEAK